MGVTGDIKRYLRGVEFRDKLVDQYTRFEILSEAGLRTAIANLLGAKIQALGDPAEGYRVTCESRLAFANVIPDITIWKDQHPRICIELKDTGKFDTKKARNDWEKLQDYCSKISTVKAGFLIYVARRDGRDFPVKRDRQTIYWPVKIALEPLIPDFERWRQERRQRAKYMPTQRAAQPTSRKLRRAADARPLKGKRSRRKV